MGTLLYASSFDEVTNTIHGVQINGIDVDAETRCAHYHTDLDIIAIKFKCCERWFPCFDCHMETADHNSEAWAATERDTRALLCGKCGHQLTINEYFGSNSACPACTSLFNPGCKNHYHLYFEM